MFTYSSWAPHTYDFVVLTSLTDPRKIILVVLQIRKAKDLSAPLYTLTFLSINLYSCCSLLEQRASVKRFVSLQLFNPKTVDRTPWTGDQPVARSLPTQNNYRQTSIPWVGFQPKIPVFGRVKTFHALDGAATVIGNLTFGWFIPFAPTWSVGYRWNASFHFSFLI
jgi:hypothetical protein